MCSELDDHSAHVYPVGSLMSAAVTELTVTHLLREEGLRVTEMNAR